MDLNLMHGFQAGVDGERVSLTATQKAQIAARSRKSLSMVLLAQTCSGLLVSLILLLFAGWGAGLSALCGSLSYLVPNALFVARLVISTFSMNGSAPGVFLLGNGLKVVVAVLLLWALSGVDAGWVDWLAVFAGLVATLKGYWVAVLLTGGRITKHV